ncbi:MAG: glycosyltransferase family 2 protein [Parvibaculaceae bacterium]
MAEQTVSVIIPCADQSQYLATAIASLARQTRPVDEIILVHPADDGATAALALRLAGTEPRLKIVSVAERLPAAARNAGLLAAGGDVIGFLDADDAWTPTKLALQLAKLASLPEAAAVGGLLLRCDDIDLESLAPVAVSGEAFVAPTLGALLCRRAVFDRIGLLDTEQRYSEDVEFYMRMRDLGVAFLALDEVVLYYRQHPASMMHASTPRKDSDLRLAVFKSIRRRRRLGLAPSQSLVFGDSIEKT